MKNLKRSIFFVLFLSCFLLFSFKLLFFQSETRNLLERSTNGVLQKTKDAAKNIDQELQKFVPITEKVAEDITSGQLPLERQPLINRLHQTLDSNQLYEGVGIAFAPYAYSSEVKLFAPYYHRDVTGTKLLEIEKAYDYTSTNRIFYDVPMANGSTWLEPHFTKSTRKFVAEYASVFHLKFGENTEKQRAGVVFLNYSFNGIRKMMASMDLGQSGYGFILSKEGKLVFHPNGDYVREGYTLEQLAAKEHPAFLELKDKIKNKCCDHIEFVNQRTGESSWVFVEPIPATQWSLCVVTTTDEAYVDASTRKSDQVDIVFYLILTVVFFMLWIGFYRREPTTETLAYTAAVLSAIFVIGIFLFWAVITMGDHREKGDKLPIVNMASLEQFKDAYREKCDMLHLPVPIFIPTGIFLQSLEFTGPNSVMVTGYAWQKYRNDLPEGLEQGIVLPESDSPGYVDEIITKVYERKFADFTTIGWYFQTTVRQNFNYQTYPLDQENVWLRIWHRDFDRNVVLVPDLEAYSMLKPSSLPGIEKDFVLLGWTFFESFFSYRNNSYNTNFGIPNFVGLEDSPELYFNMLIKRKLLNPFIADLLPLIVVVILLFTILLLVTKRPNTEEHLGYSASDVIQACAALFFVVIIAQIQLREKLMTPHLIYLEYFYFVSYFLLLGVGLNALIFSGTKRFAWIHYRDNLIPKLLFWPFSLAIMFIVTYLTFV